MAKTKTAPKRNRRGDLIVDQGILNAVTTRSLKSGVYQNKIVAAFAHLLAPGLMNSLRRGLESGDPAAQRLTAEIMSFTKRDKGGISVNVNQTNQTANVTRGGGDPELRSFEDIARQVAEARQRKQLAAGAVTIVPEFVPTPED